MGWVSQTSNMTTQNTPSLDPIEYRQIYINVGKKFRFLVDGSIIKDSVQHGYLKYYESVMENEVENRLGFVKKCAENYIKDLLKEKFRGIKLEIKPWTLIYYGEDRDILEGQINREEIIVFDRVFSRLCLADKEFLKRYLENFGKWGTIKTGADYMRFSRLKKKLATLISCGHC